LLVYETLSIESRLDYDDVIEAVKRKFGVTLTACRKRSLNVKCGENELQHDIVIRLRKYYLSWLAKADYEPNFEDILEHIVLDRYFQSQSQDLKIYLREQGRLKMSEMISKAQNYIDAHDFRDNKSNHGNRDKKFEHKKFEHKGKDVRVHENKFSNSNSNFKAQDKVETFVKKPEFTKRTITCFNCVKIGHKSFDCINKKKNDDKKANKESVACMLVDSQSAKSQDNDVVFRHDSGSDSQ
jgi:hypothetical protein